VFDLIKSNNPLVPVDANFTIKSLATGSGGKDTAITLIGAGNLNAAITYPIVETKRSTKLAAKFIDCSAVFSGPLSSIFTYAFKFSDNNQMYYYEVNFTAAVLTQINALLTANNLPNITAGYFLRRLLDSVPSMSKRTPWTEYCYWGVKCNVGAA